MSKRVLILSGSPRKNGNSDILCDEFARGAIEVGHKIEKVFVNDKKIGYCKACYHCRNNDGKCIIKDDMSEILEKINLADVIVLASPVYFYSINAQMKAVIDRTLAMWTQIKDKDFYYIMTAAEGDKSVMDVTLECFRGFAKCLDGSKEKGVIYGTGVYEAGAVKTKNTIYEAYKMGKEIK